MAQPWPLGTKGKFAKTRVRRGQTEEEDTVLFFDQKTSEKSYPFSAFFKKKKMYMYSCLDTMPRNLAVMMQSLRDKV